MSASAERFCSPGESRTTMRGLEKWNTAHSARRFVAPDLMPLGTGMILPQLAGIEPELQWVSDDRSLVTLAKILVELGIGDPHDWAGCGKDPSKYAVKTASRYRTARCQSGAPALRSSPNHYGHDPGLSGSRCGRRQSISDHRSGIGRLCCAEAVYRIARICAPATSRKPISFAHWEH